jgi:exodeoxyribonuclease V
MNRGCCSLVYSLKVPEHQYSINIIDEASMVNEVIYNDLRDATPDSFRIWIGDHGQLNPVNSSFSLMKDPQFRLEKIHRQVADSPILKLAMAARAGEPLGYGEFGTGVERRPTTRFDFTEWDVDDFDTMVLCYLRRTRVVQNKAIREVLGFDPARPRPGDRVLCKRGDRERGVWNGMRGQVLSIKPDGDDHYRAKIRLVDVDEVYRGRILRHGFNSVADLQVERGTDLWDYGYCQTVHTAQGSEADTVVLIDQSDMVRRYSGRDESKRWLYTGITRARKDLMIAVLPYGTA